MNRTKNNRKNQCQNKNIKKGFKNKKCKYKYHCKKKKYKIMNSHTPDLTVFEIKKIIEVNKTMNLLDLNGSKINFQSEFIITAKDSSKNYSATVVNQEELDQGTFNFENSVEGKFTRKVIFQDNKHQNHFVAIKKLSNDRSTDPIICDVVITLQELPSIEQSSENTI